MQYSEFLDQIRDNCKMTTSDAIVITDVFNKNKKYMCFRLVVNYITCKLSGLRVVNIYLNKRDMTIESYKVDSRFYEEGVEDSIEAWLDQLIHDETHLMFDYQHANIHNMNHMTCKNISIIEKINTSDKGGYLTFLYDGITNVEAPFSMDCHHHHGHHKPPMHGEIGKIVEDIAHKQRHIDEELKSARENIDGEKYSTLGARLDTMDATITNLMNKVEELQEDVSGITDGTIEILGGATFPETFITNNKVGGVESGTTIEEGTPLADVFKDVLVSYIPPTIELSLDPSTAVYSVGDTIESLSLVVSLTDNSEPLTVLKLYRDSELIHTVDAGIFKGGIFTYPYTIPINSDTIFTATVTDGRETVSDVKTITFIHPYFYGVSDTNTFDNFDTLTKGIETEGDKELEFTADNQYICFAYDVTYDDLTSILDESGFENLTVFERRLITVNGVAYKMYITNTPVTCTNFNYIFK